VAKDPMTKVIYAAKPAEKTKAVGYILPPKHPQADFLINGACACVIGTIALKK
jgi:hypothetical protein